MMTSCGQQSLNVLTVLSLLISAGRNSVGAQWGGEWGRRWSLPGVGASPVGVLGTGRGVPLVPQHPRGEELIFGAVQ